MKIIVRYETEAGAFTTETRVHPDVAAKALEHPLSGEVSRLTAAALRDSAVKFLEAIAAKGELEISDPVAEVDKAFADLCVDR